MVLKETEHIEILEETSPFFLLFDPLSGSFSSNCQTHKLLFPQQRFARLPEGFQKLMDLVKSKKEISHWEWKAGHETFLLNGRLLETGKILVTGQPIGNYLKEKEAKAIRETRQLMEKVNLTIIHELRRPLYNIVLGLEDLKSNFDPLTQEMQEQFTFLERNRQKIQSLIDKLSYPDSVFAVFKSSVDFFELLEKPLQKLRDDIRFTQIHLEVNLEKTLIPMLLDKDKIILALDNIFLNAVEAVDPGCGKITVSSTTENDHVHLIISDNGHGIPIALQPKLFQSYFTTKPNGLGLGLATAKKIFDAHDIGIAIKSEEKKGSTFTLSFPLHSTTEN